MQIFSFGTSDVTKHYYGHEVSKITTSKAFIIILGKVLSLSLFQLRALFVEQMLKPSYHILQRKNNCYYYFVIFYCNCCSLFVV